MGYEIKFFVRPMGKGKTYKDLRIEWLKKYGVKNMWRDYCEVKGHILYRERK